MNFNREILEYLIAHANQKWGEAAFKKGLGDAVYWMGRVARLTRLMDTAE